jgi:plasmid stabilization system protein ParE
MRCHSPRLPRQWAEQHALYYQVRGACVVVVRVLHQRMDATRHM